MSKILSIKFLLLTQLKKKQKEISKEKFEGICKSLDLIKDANSHYLIWKEQNSNSKISINISDFKIYSQNKSGDTKSVVKENEKLAANLVEKILAFN
tara:strand:+ start:540 stop:830 length:291 start_codon:yes stop_codon:yes gene_type:complete